MTMRPHAKTTRPRLSGELFIVALEIASLYLQRDECGLQKKLDALTEAERAAIAFHAKNLWLRLVKGP